MQTKAQINNQFSAWKDILFGILPGYILDPLLINKFFYDLLIFKLNRVFVY